MNIGFPDASDSRDLLPALAVLPGHLVWRAHGRVAQALSEELPEGVDIHAYAVLLALAGGSTMSQQALSRTVSVSRTTMVKVAADLAARGLVERVRNADDRRSYALTRTPKGAAAARSWRRHTDELETSLTASFSDAERDELRSLLQRIIEPELAADTPEPLRASIAFLVVRVHYRMHRFFLRALQPLRIEPRHFGTLVALASTGPLSQTDVARVMGVSGASMVQIADDLERRGLVSRRRRAGDRRTQELANLPAAADVLARARALADETMKEVLHTLTAAQTRRLVTLLERLVTAP